MSIFLVKRSIQQQQLLLQRRAVVQRRHLSFWTIPKFILATRGRGAVLGALGATTLLSSFVGPVIWVAVGGAASVFSWRIYAKAKNWWNYLTPSQPDQPLANLLLSHISSHRASDKVRAMTIEHLTSHFDDKTLKTFDLSHPSQLVWDQVHKSEMTKVDDNHYRIQVYFWVDDGIAQRPKEGGCEIVTSALVDTSGGNVKLNQIKILAPGSNQEINFV